MANGYIIAGNGLIADKNTARAEGLTWPPAPIGYNGHSYVADFKIETGTTMLSVFKKIVPIPGGIPYFTELDTVNRPAVNGSASAFYPDSGGNTVYFCYNQGNGLPLSIQTFNLDTETWGAVVSAAGPTPSQSDHFRFVHRTNGDWVVAYDTTTGPETLDVYWSKYNGAWSAGVRVSTVSSGGTDQANIADICLKESTGDIAFFWIQTLFSEGYTPNHLYVTVLSSADALGGNYNWLNTVTSAPYWEVYGRPIYNSAQDEWEYPAVFKNSTNSFFNTFGIMSISPAGAPAAATQTNIIAANDGTVNVAFPRAAVDVTNSTLNFLWANNFDGSTGNPQLLVVSRPLNNSSPFPVTHSLDIFSGDVWTPNGMIYDANLQTFQIDTVLEGTVLFEQGVDSLLPTPDADVSSPFMDLSMFSVQAGTIRAANNPLCDYQYYFEAIAGIAIACPLVNTGSVGTLLSIAVVVTGDTPPDLFELVAGSLPPGMTLNSTTGVISGTPSLAGTYHFTIKVTDSLNLTATTSSCPLVISAPPVLICPTQKFQLGVAYDSFVTVIGGTAPYTFSVIGGTLPTGISLNAVTGELTGTPSAISTGAITYKVVDANGLTATVSCGGCVALPR